MATEFSVYSKNGTPVRAKYLEIHGRPVFDASGNPYIVPADFDWNNYMGSLKGSRPYGNGGYERSR